MAAYIAWCNGTRLHGSPGYRSPAGSEEDSKIKKVARPFHQPYPSKRGPALMIRTFPAKST
jgi:hypothetical protein